MIYLFFFLLEVSVLYRLSQIVSYRFYKSLPFILYVILFLPGTFIHELSHLLMAKILFVPVGKFNLKPTKMDKEIVLGSVSIAKVDLLRRLVIGSAPMIFGLLIVVSTVYFSISSGLLKDWKITFLISYVVFVIGNTMFSSKKDLEGAWKVGLASALIFIFFYVVGIRVYINTGNQVIISFTQVLKLVDIYLLVPILINFSISACYYLKNKIL